MYAVVCVFARNDVCSNIRASTVLGCFVRVLEHYDSVNDKL